MECVTITNSETAPNVEEDKKLKNNDSAEQFQQFIYELFEKNGILNDLRAYLRGHIVEVLKSSQTGEPPTCQKHFTQRLELENQALNMLVVEYLLRHEFDYSLSVFISEIPLANMVFGLAKTLMMQGDAADHSKLWFSDSDVWSVLNYLGIKCDSRHATNIVETYKNKESPLLMCILKCLPFYCKQDIPLDQGNTSMESLTSEKSSESLPEKIAKHQKDQRPEKCKHYAHCKSCQHRLRSVKEKYVKKKKNLAKNTTYIPPTNTQNVENLMKNVSFAEKTLIDEMFHQLKNVYETEIAMVKEEEEKKYKQALASYVVQLQKRQTEMEETYKQRETELETSVQQKKKFLWGLAQALRDQHRNMAAAMTCVKGESDRLTAKEDNIKTQLIEAENMIKNRGEEMRAQISNEILILEQHLESMKKERSTIDKEKENLERFKTLYESKCSVNDDSKFEQLKKEIITLKKFVEDRKLRVIEKCTMTDLESGGRMNNQEVGMKSDSEEKVGRTPNQVVNDLKKQKNVNFNQSQLDSMYQENRRDCIRSHSTEGFEERDARHEAIFVLQDENDRLKHFARQQEQHIDELNMQTARLQAELAATRLRPQRPRTAPAMSTRYEYFEPRVNTSTSATYNTFARSLGAGEDTIFNARVVGQNDAVPIDRRVDSRRYLIQQWRALRCASPSCNRQAILRPDRHTAHGNLSVDTEPMRETAEHDHYTQNAEPDERPIRPTPDMAVEDTARCKSPKSVLKEAKLKLRNKVKEIPRNHPEAKRENSPNTVLREAKLRLRKLEIEAEAVERSYLDFRKRRSMREQKSNYEIVCNNVTIGASGPFDRNDHQDICKTARDQNSNLQKCKRELDNYLTNYEKKFNTAESHFRNKSPIDKAKVIPQSFVQIDKENISRKDNTYLETPLTEFRKLYSQKSTPIKPEQAKPHTAAEMNAKNNNSETEVKKEIKNRRITRPKDDKKELQILKENINKIYKSQEPIQTKDIEEDKNNKTEDLNDKNRLRIEIESVTESNNLKLKECEAQDLLLVVQSSAESKNASNASHSDFDEEVPPQMTIIVSPKVRSTKDSNDTPGQSLNVPVRLEEPEKLSPSEIRDVLDTLLHENKEIVTIPKVEQGGSQDFLESTSDPKADDYIDDFSADVDNYGSRSDYGDTSPVSHIKTSEDENFWD